MARPRSIPETEALKRALFAFWEQGYDRTSIADLSAAVGLGPSSLYNSFGSKLMLFQRAIDLYMETHVAFVGEILSRCDPEPQKLLDQMLRALISLYVDPKTPTGCAMFQSAGAGSPHDSEACAITAEIKASLRKRLQDFLEAREVAGHRLTASPQTLALFLLGTMRGLSQLACDGATQADLNRLANHASRSCFKQQ